MSKGTEDKIMVIPMLPLPDGKKLTSNNTEVGGIKNYEIKDYEPNGKYIVSASSSSSDQRRPYMVFNNDEVKYWECDYKGNPGYNINSATYPKYLQDPFNSYNPSTYRGGGSPQTTWETVIGSNKLKGEWVQVQMPYKIYLTKYSILTPSSSKSTFPLKFTVVGSNDGKTWSFIDQRNLSQEKLPPLSRQLKTFNINSIDKFSYFRLIISEMPSGINTIRIHQWNLFGIEVLMPNPDAGKEEFSGSISGSKEEFSGLKEEFSTISDTSTISLDSKACFTSLEREFQVNGLQKQSRFGNISNKDNLVGVQFSNNSFSQVSSPPVSLSPVSESSIITKRMPRLPHKTCTKCVDRTRETDAILYSVITVGVLGASALVYLFATKK